MARHHGALPSTVSVARAGPASLRCDRRDGSRSRTTRKRRAGRCCNPVVEVAAPPLSARVVRFVLEAHRDAVAGEAPQLLHEPVVELPGPLALEERDDLLTPLEELVAVAPLRVRRVRQRHLLGVAGVPGVLGRLDLLPGGLLIEWRHRGPDLLILAALLHALVLLSASMLAARYIARPAPPPTPDRA